MDNAQYIISYLNSHKEAMQYDLEQFVRIESPSNSPIQLHQAFQYLAKHFEKLSFHCIWVPGKESGGYLFARPKNRIKGKAYQLIIGHTDTVWPIGTIAKMPYLAHNDKLSGPGIYDMKAGIIQLIYALKTIKALAISMEVVPLILINSDEEIGSKESTSIIKMLSKISSRAFILEPSLGLQGKLKTRRSGVGKYLINIKGKAAHAGLDPEKGASAIKELSHVILKLFAFNNPEKGVSVNVGMIDGGVRPNVIAPESSAIVDVRVRNNIDAYEINTSILNIKPENPNIEIVINGGFGRPPMEGTKQNRELWKLAKNKAELINVELEEAMAGGGSDGNTTSQYTATLDGLGAIGDGAHAMHEFAFKSKLIERSALLCLLLVEGPLFYRTK